MARPGESLLDRIGNTPLLRFDRLTTHLSGVTLLGKAEWYNPGGSVKDRAAANIVAEGQSSGQFAPGKILLDATSGNTGIAYAMLGAAEGFPVTLCMPANVSAERKKILSAYGANILYTDPGDGSDGAIRLARELAARHPCLYFYADQYSSEANWRAHYHGTANEIWQQTEGRVTHFVAMLGTSGTFMGTTRRLKELNPAICCISLQPDSAFHGIEGAKHMASAIVPAIYDPTLADENLEIATEDAYAMARHLASDSGLLLGISAAAGVYASLRVGERLQVRKQQEAVIVTILCDSGEKYLSERFWTEG
ncbi:MAG: PLP-dependent cysteine synthase family protein [Candidatus Sulfotelmatobacter sp.]